MSEMSQAQTPATGASDPLPGGVPEVTDDLDRADRTAQPEDDEDDGLLSADVGHDRNAPAEADVSAPGDPDSASDPMPDIAGTGS